MVSVYHNPEGIHVADPTNRSTTVAQSQRLEEQLSENQKQITAVRDELRTSSAMISNQNSLLRRLSETVAKYVSFDLCPST